MRELQGRGLPVLFGDGEDPDSLESLPLRQARWVITTFPQWETNRALLHAMSAAHCRGHVVGAVRDAAHGPALAEAGVGQILNAFDDAADDAAARLAHETGATLTLMHVLPGGTMQELRQWLGSGHAVEQHLHDNARQQLRQLADELKATRHVGAPTVRSIGSVLDDIVSEASGLDAALVVLVTAIVQPPYGATVHCTGPPSNITNHGDGSPTEQAHEDVFHRWGTGSDRLVFSGRSGRCTLPGRLRHVPGRARGTRAQPEGLAL